MNVHDEFCHHVNHRGSKRSSQVGRVEEIRGEATFGLALFLRVWWAPVAKVGFGMEVAKCIVLAARRIVLQKLQRSQSEAGSSVSQSSSHWFIVIFVLIDSSLHRLID